MNSKFDAKQIARYLEKYKNELKDRYQWQDNWELMPYKAGELNGLTPPDFVKRKSAERNLLMRPFASILLKAIVKNNNDMLYKAITDWIVVVWGGIRGGKKRSETDPPLLQMGQLKSKLAFDRIASTSKILAFFDPEKYAVFDARVAYSLNWIILSTEASNLFFPMPLSQNRRINGFDMEVLIRLKYVENYREGSQTKDESQFVNTRDKRLFLDKSHVYNIYCELMHEIANELWGTQPQKLLKTEMLLFAIADTVVFSEIVNQTKISIVPEGVG